MKIAIPEYKEGIFEEIRDALQKRFGKTEIKVCVVAYGCQMNVCDGEKLSFLLEKCGCMTTSEQKEADILIFNTCCVREHAEARVYGNIGALRKRKEATGGKLMIGICGCMMQQKKVAQHIRTRYPFVDFVFGTHNLHTFPYVLNNALGSSKTVVDVWEEDDGSVYEMDADRNNKYSAFVTVMQGCNNFCSYCIVPYVRGRERSRAPEAIINEIRSFAQGGTKEITLLGQNVNSYGNDVGDDITFPKLLRMIDSIDGIERIRFMTSHPKDLSDELIETMANSKHICRQLHLPIQSGNNRILDEMNRRYTVEKYLSIVEKARMAMPDMGLSTDIIVGFPTESEAEFNDTVELLKKVEYTNAFLFKYSPRSGTTAAEMEGQVAEEIKEARHSVIMNVQNEITARNNAKLVGETFDVLAENLSKKDKKRFSGRTESGILMNFAADKNVVGKIVKVEVSDSTVSALNGICTE